LIFPEFVFGSRFTKAEKADTGKPEKNKVNSIPFSNLLKNKSG
jgi:hypothetical protein